jgi:hypothetical protein
MGWYLRKSLSFGPVRLNLSKSGLGYSVGVKGARIGTGPRGNYIHMGRYGLYYRQSLSQGAHSEVAPRKPVPTYPDNGTTVIGSVIATADVSGLQDTSAEGLLSHIREQHQKTLIAPWVTAGSTLILIAMFAREVSLWLIALCAVLTLLAHLMVSRFDKGRKRVTLNYRLDASAQSAYDALLVGMKWLASCQRVWRILTRDLSSDPKYTAGATQLINRRATPMSQRAPRFFEVNVPVWNLELGGQTLYFFPDRVLIYQGSQVGAVSYADLTATHSITTFVESDGVPSDARVVATTWRYANKGGGPDRRFANNPSIPVAEYAALTLRSQEGLNIALQCSGVSASKQFVDSLSKYCSIRTTTSVSDTSAKQPEEQESPINASILEGWGWLAAPLVLVVLCLAALLGPHDTYLQRPPSPPETATVKEDPLPDVRLLRQKGTQASIALPASTSDTDLARAIEAVRSKITNSQLSELGIDLVTKQSTGAGGTIFVFRTDGTAVPPLSKTDAVIKWKGTASTATLRTTTGAHQHAAIRSLNSAQTTALQERQPAPLNSAADAKK